MKRIRIGTLMLLVVMAALAIALVTQERRAARREADLWIRIQRYSYYQEMIDGERLMLKESVKDLQAKLDNLGRSSDGTGRNSDGK
jgi:type II secretory pathway component PulK